MGLVQRITLYEARNIKWIENGLPDRGKREITKANPDKDNVGDKDKNTKIDPLFPLPLSLSLLDQVGLQGLAKTPGQDAVQEVPPEVEVVLTPQPHLRTMLMLVTMTKMVMVVSITTTMTFVIMARFPHNDDNVGDDGKNDDIEVVLTRPAAVDDDNNDDNIDDSNDSD